MDHVDPILLSSYLDEEVTADERASIEHHLKGCADCRTELASLRSAVQLLGQLPAVPLPRTFYLTEEMVNPTPPARVGWWQRLMPLFAPLGAAAALLLCVVMSAQLFGGANSAVPARSGEAPIAVAATEDSAGDSSGAAEATAEMEGVYEAAPAPMATDAADIESEAGDGEASGGSAADAPSLTQEPAAATVVIAATEEGSAATPPPSETMTTVVPPAAAEATAESDSAFIDATEAPAATEIGSFDRSATEVTTATDPADGERSSAPPDGEGAEAAQAGAPARSPLLAIAAALVIIALVLMAVRVVLYRR